MRASFRVPNGTKRRVPCLVEALMVSVAVMGGSELQGIASITEYAFYGQTTQGGKWKIFSDKKSPGKCGATGYCG